MLETGECLPARVTLCVGYIYMDYLYNKYIADVLDSKILVCKNTLYAVKRHTQDLKKKDFPYYFSDTKAQQAIDFFKCQVHTEGKLALQTLTPEPWQEFIIASIYGWRRRDNNCRRFRRVYLQVARKNGKTFLASGVGLYDLVTEPGAKVFSAATKKDQARISFEAAKKTAQYSPLLSKYIKTYAHSIVFRDSKFCALSADSNMQDGLNCSCAIIDEYHAHKTDNLLNVIQSGMTARQQPLMFIITTAGHNIAYPCYEEYTRVCKMLSGQKAYANDEYFAIIYELDKKDDIENPQNWQKANPNLGVSVEVSAMQQLWQEAQQKPSNMAEFKTKQLDIWCNNADVWLDDRVWQRCIKRFSLEAYRQSLSRAGR